MLFFTISDLKSARTCKSLWVVLSRKPVYSGISKLILQCPYSFHILCTILSTVYLHTVLSIFPFLFYKSHLKAGAVQLSISFSLCIRSTIDQLNAQATTVENKQQYTLCNIIYIAFQNYFPFLKFSLK